MFQLKNVTFADYNQITIYNEPLLWLMRFYNAVIKTLLQDKYRINFQ